MLKKPLKKIRQDDGSISLENLMRQHRFVVRRNARRYYLSEKEHWPADKLPKKEYYTREFVEVMTSDEGGILDRLGLDSDRKNGVRKLAPVLGQTKLSTADVDRMLKTFFWALKNHPLSKCEDPKEFEEDTRTREERIADTFIEYNTKRAKAPLGSKPPFPDRLIDVVLDRQFLQSAGVAEETMAKLLEIQGPAASMTGSRKEFASNQIGRALYNCPLIKNRFTDKSTISQRQYVSPLSSMRSIFRELRLEAGQVYADRNPDRGNARGSRNTKYSEDLLRTIFSEPVLVKLGLYRKTGDPITSYDHGFEFLSDRYELPVPLKGRDGLEYRTVDNALYASKTDDPELRKKIASVSARDAWLLTKDLPEPENYWKTKLKLTELKFRMNPDLMKRLLSTTGRRLDVPNSKIVSAVRDDELRRVLPESGQADRTWILGWKQQIDVRPDKGALDSYWDSLNEKQKDSLHMCIGRTVVGAFRAYKEKHPNEFPQIQRPTAPNNGSKEGYRR